MSVSVSSDAAAPTTTVQLNDQTPTGSYTAAVKVTLRSSDGASGTGVDR